MQTYGNKKNFVDYIFWIVLIIFTNPGGILEALGEDSSDGGINVTDLLFGVLAICFVLVFNKNVFFKDKSFIKISKYLLIFYLYYLIVFCFFVPQFKDSPDYSVLATITKIRHGVINMFLVPIVYIFYLRSYKLFFKFLAASSIAVIILFLITVLLGVDILPAEISDRGFVSINRLIMISYGLMPLLIPMGVVMLTFNFKVENKTLILIASLLMVTNWILSLIRREIISVIILFILAYLIRNYIYRKHLIELKKMFSMVFYFIILIAMIKVTLPKYFDAVVVSMEESYYTVVHGRSTVGYKDARLGFGKRALQEKIKQNYIIGTGFDNKWRVSEMAGYEASDYPFLAAIAMAGIIGLFFFLPVYIQIIKNVYRDLKYLRKSGISLKSLESYGLILFITYFIFDLAIYVYWFLPFSLFTHGGHHKWYIFLAMYFGARMSFYGQTQNKLKNNYLNN